MFTCENESFGTSDSQWLEVAKNTFQIYAGGYFVESRPRAIYEHPVLTIPFTNRAEFLDFLFRARAMLPTRLVTFRVSSRELRRVACTVTSNLTPVLRVDGDESDLPPTSSSYVIIRA